MGELVALLTLVGIIIAAVKWLRRPIQVPSRSHFPPGINADEVQWPTRDKASAYKPVLVGTWRKEWHCTSNGETRVLVWKWRVLVWK